MQKKCSPQAAGGCTPTIETSEPVCNSAGTNMKARAVRTHTTLFPGYANHTYTARAGSKLLLKICCREALSPFWRDYQPLSSVHVLQQLWNTSFQPVVCTHVHTPKLIPRQGIYHGRGTQSRGVIEARQEVDHLAGKLFRVIPRIGCVVLRMGVMGRLELLQAIYMHSCVGAQGWGLEGFRAARLLRLA